MNSVNVPKELNNFCDQVDESSLDTTFISKLLGEMKSQFNKSDTKIEIMDDSSESLSERSSSHTEPEIIDNSQNVDKNVVINENKNLTNEVDESVVKSDIESLPNADEEIKNDAVSDNEEKSDISDFIKADGDAITKNDTSFGRRSLRNKNFVGSKFDLAILKRSSRRRSKESVLQSAIARKEKSYNESTKPQRLTRKLKPTQKILENIAFAKQERKTGKSSRKTSDSEDDELYMTEKKCSLKPKQLQRSAKRVKFKQSESGKDTDSDESLHENELSPKRRSQRISSSRQKEDIVLNDSANPSPNIADQAKDFPNDPECSSVATELIASRLCLCTQNTKLFMESNESEEVYCMAVDSIGDKLIGCSRLVNCATSAMLRPSHRVPYGVLCDLHRNRMIRHNCCPTCGLFCTQGRFVECNAKHQYHQNCKIAIGNLECCPHCGISSQSNEIFITMYCSKKPVFLPIQKSHHPPAKMSFTQCNENIPQCSTPPLIPFETFQNINSNSINDIEDQIFRANDLINAVASEDLNQIATIIASSSVDLNFKLVDFNGGTILHFAAQNGFLATVHLLVNGHMEIDVFDNEQNTPLMLSITEKKNDVAQYLMKTGASIILKGTDGMTALHLAAKCGNLQACKILLKSGYSIKNYVNMQDDGGWTPLVWACEHGYVDVAKYLIAKGADPDLRDVEHNVALHWAAFSGSTHIAELLLNLGCEVNAVNAHGDTPLHIGAREDKYNCIIVLLARGANVTIVNKNNETPLDCVPEDGESYNVIALNVHLQSISGSDSKEHKTLLNNDISRGREANPVQCFNTVDEEPEPKDFIYITKNCLTSHDITIESKITSMHTCNCEDRCMTDKCDCSKLSLKCWYDEEGKLVQDFNFADTPLIFECNETCSCNAITCVNRVMQKGLTQRFQLYKTESKGWGIKTIRFIPKGSYVCEYVGEILTDVHADTRADDTYLFDLDNRETDSFCIDAKYYGNFARFINHSCNPNLQSVKVYTDHHDLRFPKVAFFAKRDISLDEELSFDYGAKFWLVKYKSFTCQCQASNCKYSEDSIKETLERYKTELEELS